MSKTSPVGRLPWVGLLASGVLLLSSTSLAQVWFPATAQMVPIGSSVELPVVAEAVVIDIDGQHASTRLQQTFHNGTGMNVEGRYTLSAGPGARANGFAYWNGEQKIVGEVFEKDVARQVYQRVVSRRRDPGLLEEKREGEFSFVVAPITPDERKRVEVSYSRWLSRQNGVIEVTAPASRADADIQVTLNDPRRLEAFASSTHDIEVKQLASGKILIRSKKARGEGKPFVLQYRVAERPWTVNAYVHRNTGQDAYFALTLASPADGAKAPMPKDVTLVIDRSGSMSGDKIKQAREACLGILKRLGEKDRFNVILFDDRVEQLFRAPEPVTARNRGKGLEYIELASEGGGTSLHSALLAALTSQRDGAQPRVVLFFTDGQSDPEPVIEAAGHDRHDVRVFTIGLGREINRSLLSRLAASKRGRFTYIPDAGDIERTVAALYGQIESPLIIDVALESQKGLLTSTYPRAVPDLFNNDELLITGRLRGQGTIDLVLHAKENGKPVALRTEVFLRDEMPRPWVGRLWAKSRIDDLLDEINLNGDKKELSDEVTELALAYNFATPYTSFLAIPESEVDAVSAQDLASARARKRAVMSRKAGSAELADSAGGSAPAATAAAPAPAMAPATDEAGSDSRIMTEEAMAQPDGVKELQRKQAREGGCASCNVGDHGEAGERALLGIAIAALAGVVVRRRRRR